MAQVPPSSSHLVKQLRGIYKSGRTRSLQWRQNQLQGVIQICKEKEEEIIDALASDLGKPRFEAFLAEVNSTAESARFILKNVKRWMQPQQVPTNMANFPGKSEIVPEPYGVVLIICPWNFPFMLSIEPLLGAIAAGNVVLLKPSELAPATSSLLAKLLPLYLDSEAIRVVEGDAHACSTLLEHKFDKIFFTGGTAVGKIVSVAAAKHLTPITLELGGKNPAVVDSDVDLEITARRIVSGRYMNSGQICLSPDYILAEKSIVSKLTDYIVKTIQEFYGSEPTKSPDLSRIINEKHHRRLISLLNHPETIDKVVYSGEHDEKKLFIHPTVLRDVPWNTPIMQQEIFGPILVIQTISSMEEAADIVSEREKPLALYVFSNSEKSKQLFLTETSSGGLYFNDTIVHVTNSFLRFGGVRESGMGSYHGQYSFECFSHQKPVLNKPLAQDLPQRYPPYTESKEPFFKALLSVNFTSLLL